MKFINSIYKTITNVIDIRYKWKTYGNDTITFTDDGKVIIYCNEYLLSKQIIEKYSALGCNKDEIVLQICQWIRERIDPICKDLQKHHRSVIGPFEIFYRWYDVDVLTDYYT